MTKEKIIIGLKHEIEDAETDATTTFHVIRHISLDPVGGYHSVVVDSYVKQSTFARGGRAAATLQLSLQGEIPRGKDALNWLYESLAAPSENGNTLSGAELVFSE